MPARSTQRNLQLRRGFTLVEILIVVVILGILAAIVVPAFGGTTQEARKGAFVAELKIFANATEYYSASQGMLADSSSGSFPPELVGLAKQDGWNDGTPIGGVWDIEANDNGITLGVGVHFQGDNPGDAFMTDIDGMFDDGNIASGVFRQLNDANRFYWVVIP